MMEFFWRRLRRGDRGFTLIELLIVVAIIAILAAVLIPNFLRSRGQSRVAASKGNMKNLGTALESYFVSTGTYPSDAAGLGGLVAGGFINAIPNMPNGSPYSYDAGVSDLSYRVCDNTTDLNVTATGTATTWYYNPLGGLQSVSAAGTSFPACPAAP